MRPRHGAEWRAALARLPALHGKSVYAGLTPATSITRADELDRAALDALEHERAACRLTTEQADLRRGRCLQRRLSMKTQNKHIDLLREVFAHHIGLGELAGPNPLAGLRYKPRHLGRAPREQRRRWTEDEVRVLFGSPRWSGALSRCFRTRPGEIVVKDARYWVPLMLAHMGVRPNAAAQALLTDVVQIEDVWCLVVGDDRDTKDIKTANARRVVPIHPLLNRLGLLDHVARCRAQGVERLFPELRRGCGGGLAEGVCKDFAYYQRKVPLLCGIDAVLYGLRHSFDTALLHRHGEGVLVSEVMGHARTGETTGRYYKGAQLAALAGAIAAIDYGLEVVERDGERHLAPVTERPEPERTALEHLDILRLARHAGEAEAAIGAEGMVLRNDASAGPAVVPKRPARGKAVAGAIIDGTVSILGQKHRSRIAR